jgi:hypothetical protein
MSIFPHLGPPIQMRQPATDAATVTTSRPDAEGLAALLPVSFDAGVLNR